MPHYHTAGQVICSCTCPPLRRWFQSMHEETHQEELHDEEETHHEEIHEEK